MKLSEQCIEAISETNEYKMCGASGASYTQRHFMQGATEALTNPSIYEKAGLISLEDAFAFLGWTREKAWGVQNQDRYSYQGKWYTTAQLYEIYKQQKEK